MAQRIEEFVTPDGGVGVKGYDGVSNEALMRRLEALAETHLQGRKVEGGHEAEANPEGLVGELRREIAIAGVAELDSTLALLGRALAATGVETGSNEYLASLDRVKLPAGHDNLDGAAVIANALRIELLAKLEGK